MARPVLGSTLFLLLLTSLTLTSPPTLASHVELTIKSDIGLFYEQLTEFGQWHRDSRYGLIWTPNTTAEHWRPYTMGHWSYTAQQGWSWSSDWSWGWATMHYGRWFYHQEHGWSWVPGTEWAPAWVAWRMDDSFIGWAPLPPEAKWTPGKGLSEQAAQAIAQLPDSAWTFVKIGDFVKPKLLPVILPSARSVTLLSLSRDITRYSDAHGLIVNHGPDRAQLEKRLRTTIPAMHYVDVTFVKGVQATRVKENQLAVFRPDLVLDNEIPEPSTKPVAPPLTTDQLKRQQAAQRQALITHQNAERAELERLHQQLLASPPEKTTAQQINQWIAQEQQALTRHNAEETRLLHSRQQIELKAQQH